MKKSLKLQEERAANITSLESIHTLAETQERELTTEESTNVDELIDSIDSIDVKIERALKSEKLMRSAASVSGVSVSQKINGAEERNRLKSSSTLAELAGNSLQLLRKGMLENLPIIRKNMDQASAIDKTIWTLTADDTTW